MLASGQNLAQRMRVEHQTPLMYEWYQEQYVGAAHGLSGIYYYLMQVRRSARLRSSAKIGLCPRYIYIDIKCNGVKADLFVSLVARVHL